MKPTKTARQYVKDLRENLNLVVKNSIMEMNVELTYINESGNPESSEYYNRETGRIELYQFDVAHGGWGRYQAGEVLSYFGYDYALNDDEEIVDSTGEPIDIGTIWTEIDSFGQEVCEVMKEEFGFDGEFFFGHLEADNSYGLFYSMDVPQV